MRYFYDSMQRGIFPVQPYAGYPANISILRRLVDEYESIFIYQYMMTLIPFGNVTLFLCDISMMWPQISIFSFLMPCINIGNTGIFEVVAPWLQQAQSNITLTSQWPRWRLKSPVSRLFTQPFIQTQIKENIKAPRHWPLCGEFTGDPYKWPVTRKMFPFDDVIMK